MRTIKQRLFGLGFLIVLVSGSVLLITYRSTHQSMQMQEQLSHNFDELNAISNANLAVKSVLLAAMDSIVDKDSGAIAPELKQEMADADAAMKQALATLRDLIDDAALLAQVEAIESGYGKIAPALTDLEKAVRFHANEETFARIDDTIDGEGGKVADLISALGGEINQRYDATSARAEANLERNMQLNVFLLGGLAVLFAVLIALFGVTLLRGLNRLGTAMAGLARGNFNTEVPGLGQKNELGAMAQHVQFFKTSLLEQERMREEQEQAKHIAEMEKKRSMQKMADEFESAVSGIVNTVASSSVQMKDFAESLSRTAEQASQRATSVAAASEEAAANVSTVAAATEELSSSISEISRQVTDSTKTASSAVEEARATNTTVNSMAHAAHKIGEVVQLISEIANQTNLLALNATIEAARAGEAGKGFAVVASEVKNLASQTARATEDITVQISGMQGVAGDAVKAIQGIGGTIERINSISTAIAAAVEEQGAATAEISRNVQGAAAGTKEVSDNITGVTQAASETGEVAAQVLESASALERESTRLKQEVQKFIQTVRAA